MRELTVLLNVSDGHRSVRYYCDNLGFRIDNQFERDGELLWAQLSFRDIRIMINVSPQRTARGARQDPRSWDDVILYFSVDDAYSLRQVLASRGCEPSAIRRQPYGLDEFTLRDPDGYELAFGSPARR